MADKVFGGAKQVDAKDWVNGIAITIKSTADLLKKCSSGVGCKAVDVVETVGQLLLGVAFVAGRSVGQSWVTLQ